MTRKPRGLVLIINNEKFERRRGPGRGLKARPGSKIDCQSLVSVFEQCYFKVELHNNKSRRVSMRS
jgi:hypothetical protein